ncbi:MAG TPA: hypothetical protein VGL38_05620 [bacterium]|jgi:hypothetical protein
MKKTLLFAIFCCAVLLALGTRTAYAQYDLTPDTAQVAVPDTTHPVPADSLKPDSAGGNAANPDSEKPRQLNNDDEIPAAPDTVPTVTAAPNSGAVALANLWLRRLLYRGHLNATEIGAYAQYQLTPWDEKVGSYGAVEARLTVYYLGSSEWMGRDAEWLQAVFQTVEGEPTTVEYDLIVPSAGDIKTVHRALYRVDGGELKALSFALPNNELDYDAADKPTEEGQDQLKLYSGTFAVSKFRGSGTDGATVMCYRSSTVPPLDVVRLGYGDAGLTLTGTGSDAAPRLDVPAPPSVGHATDDDTTPH